MEYYCDLDAETIADLDVDGYNPQDECLATITAYVETYDIDKFLVEVDKLLASE